MNFNTLEYCTSNDWMQDGSTFELKLPNYCYDLAIVLSKYVIVKIVFNDRASIIVEELTRYALPLHERTARISNLSRPISFYPPILSDIRHRIQMRDFASNLLPVHFLVRETRMLESYLLIYSNSFFLFDESRPNLIAPLQ